MNFTEAACEKLERYLVSGDAKRAEVLGKKLKTAAGDSHWNLARLSTAYYEARKYKMALRIVERARKLDPRCPYVLWSYAGTLSMIEREQEAIDVYQGLLRRGTQNIAFGECGEGARWAESLLNDCRYRIADCYYLQSKKSLAARWLKTHLDHRRPGLRSLYSLKDVKELQAELTAKK
ncbi:MAG: tetratricopeptide repeat protein [candidate division Zixibacteria bacterium]|nr:tetratricopeptide repeat protein [candidate division Zixibacteria bacterium]MDH3938814.1 tetratricopeptide repeat protein [candidate division Zixibacteria bacterium]MDH4035759.1 tetratricopeptide repeat protein [candidate division Zixibacteria bacterium]